MKYYIIFILFLLSGCAIQQRQQAELQNGQDISSCTNKYPSVQRKTIVDLVSCINDANVRYMINGRFPQAYVNLVYQYDAARQQAAVAFAEGKTTELEFRAAMNQIDANMRTATANAVDQQTCGGWCNGLATQYDGLF